LAAYNTKLEADLVVALLGEADIDAFIVADNLGGTFPMMQMVTGGYRVMVLADMLDEAREVIAAPDDAGEQEPMPPRRSAIARLLLQLTPFQMLALLLLIALSLAAIIYSVTQGTL
jgi:hypothetical protein